MAKTKCTFTCPYCDYTATGWFEPESVEYNERDIWGRAWGHLFKKHTKEGTIGWYRRHQNEMIAALDLPWQAEVCPICEFTLLPEETTPPPHLSIEDHMVEEHYEETLALSVKLTLKNDYEGAEYEFLEKFGDAFKEVA
jgi:hypothetical protein